MSRAQQKFGLGLSEISTLILARQASADLVILDDMGARKLAQRDGLRVQGTVGILEACFRSGSLRDLRQAYRQLLDRGVYLNRSLLNSIPAASDLEPL